MSSNKRSFRATRRRFIQGAAAAAAFSVSRVGRGANRPVPSGPRIFRAGIKPVRGRFKTKREA